MNFKIPPLASDIIISIYVLVTLFFRFKLENEITASPMLSLIIGICFIAILWVLIKLKVLNPNWFGLFNFKKNES